MTTMPNNSPKPLQAYLDALGSLVIGARNLDPDRPVSGATDDSRAVVPGGLFVARRGQRTDGLRYVPDAIERGARIVVAETIPESSSAGDATVWVKVCEADAAARIIAETYYDQPARRLQFAAVTGTNGKTTTAWLLAAILTRAGRTAGLIGTVCHRGPGFEISADRTTPPPFQLHRLLRRMVDAGADIVVLEASSHGLVQDRLAGLRCAAAGFTNLTGDHLDYHRSMDAYYEAKRLLFTQHLSINGAACINADDPYGRRLAGDLRQAASGVHCVTFGELNEADVRIQVTAAGLDGLQVRLALPDEPAPLNLRSPLIGRFHAWNIALAVLMARALGTPLSDVRAAVRGFRGAPGRMEPIRSRAGRLILVDYAHTDDALDRALAAVRDLAPGGRVIVTFGCGGERDKTKRPRMGRIAAARADHVIVTSDNPRSEDPSAIIRDILRGVPPGSPVEVEPDRRRAIALAVAAAEPGDVVLVAGKGHEQTQEFAGRREPFDDRQEVRNALEQLGDPAVE